MRARSGSRTWLCYFYFLRARKLISFICLILAALGLSCYAQASHCSGFSYCGALAPGAWTSVAVAHSPVVLQHEKSSQIGVKPCSLHWQADS